MSDRDSADFRPSRESSKGIGGVLLIVALIAAGAGFAWWRWAQRPEVPAVFPPPAATAPQPADESTNPPAAAATAASGPQNPLDALAEPDDKLPSLGNSDKPVAAALGELLGGKRPLLFLQLDGFVRRVVATIDNLPRQQAAARMWPVEPAPGRFTVAGGATGNATTTIDAANVARYGSLVSFAEAVDVERAAVLYARLYPLFQEAYEELGYPGRYFNDRVIAVIDHLLQAPEPSGPVGVRQTQVKGDYAASRPWTQYEFADPALESLSSGQKMMVRVGVENERRLKAKLAAFRARVATGEVAKR